MGEHASPVCSNLVRTPQGLRTVKAPIDKECRSARNLPHKTRLSTLCRLRWPSSPLLLDRNEEFGNWLSKRFGETFEAIKGWTSLPTLDEIEEVQRDGCLLRKLFLRQSLR